MKKKRVVMKKREEDGEDEDGDKKKKKKKEPKKPTKFDKKVKEGTKDVQEKRTVFLRNLSFDTTVETLRQYFEKYGKIKNCFLNYDRDFERPKGTGFVQFETAQSALDACAESDLIEIDSRKIAVNMAVSRDQVKGLVTERKTKEPKR